MRCRFKHKIFQNEENGYTIAIFTTQDTSVPLSARDKYLASRNIIGFSAIGFGLPLTDEIELEMEGRWESGEHGTQYQVENFMEVVPRTKEGILGYLSSGAIKGIGPKMADTIFRKFGLQTLEIMENNPQELLKIRGISEKKLAAIVESYGKNQVFRELMTFLAPFKVTPKKVNMILKKFGNESVDIIRHRPYMLSAVKGFGFLTVDAIGRQCCCALNDPMRISGCIGHIMNQAMKEGHLFKQRQEVIREALEMLNRDLQVMAVSEQDVSQVLYRLVLSCIQRTLAYVRMFREDFTLEMLAQDEASRRAELEQKHVALTGAHRRMEDLDKIIQHIYEDNVLGKLTDARYLKLSQEYEKEQAEISRLVAALEQEVASEAGQIADVGRFLELVDKYMEIRELDGALLNELVSKIVVHSPEKINGRKHVTIEVYFTYVGKIRIPLQIGRDALNQAEPA